MRVVIGLGANLGDRLATMREAAAQVARIAQTTVLATSSVYETAPVGGVPQCDFFNGAILVECMLSPIALLDELLRIEKALGRDRATDQVRWGPRTIDLDVLWIEGVVVDEPPRLVVPHPHLLERTFALVPLIEVAPHAVDPRTGAPYSAPATRDVRATPFTL